MGRPSSLTATMPAFCMAPISERPSPRLPIDAAPMGQTCVLATEADRSRIARVTEALSLTGRVLGMGHTAVKPPRAAARVPVSMVSELSPPGSRRWQCKSMNTGAITRPAASSVSPFDEIGVPAEFSGGETREMRPASIQISRAASVPLAGSSMRPFLMCSMSGSFGLIGFRAGGQHDKEHSHAHRQAVGNLFQDARLRAIGHGGIDLQAPNHWSGVKHKRTRAGNLEALGRKLIQHDVFVERQGRLMQPLLLHAQNNDHVGSLERLLDPRAAPHAVAKALKLTGQPHGWAAESEA